MRSFQEIQNTSYDLIVIGGGINGAGIARDAALRGLKTILIEKGDFAGGTTSCPSRLIHGGLRYLEYFEFNLVRESLREREVLLHTAPHLVRPLQLSIPIYADGARPYRLIQVGMILYDLLSYDKTVPNHRMLSLGQVRQLFRSLNPKELKGAAQYYDAQVVYAERLCLENILSAQAAGATVLNYVQVMGLEKSQNHLSTITCKDQLTGEAFTLSAGQQTVVANTTGPWVDEVLQSGEHPIREKPLMGGTKGSHIIVPKFPGAPDTAFYVEAASDNRPFFIIPWLDRYLIGTTDLPYSGDLNHVKADNQEIEYLIEETNRTIPTANLTLTDVLYTYSGVRPLPYTDAQTPSSITRKHILHDHAPEGIANLISLVGGKWTTYRQVGEEYVDAAYRKLGRPVPPCHTRKKPLPGALDQTDIARANAVAQYKSQLSLTVIDHLFSLYGSKALEVLALTEKSTDLAESIVPGLLDIKAQVVYAVETELAHTLVDICCRRMLIAMQGNYGFDALPAITETLSKHCGWSQGECDRQEKAYRTYIETQHQPDYALASAHT
ncbi:Glycerol-3-phosphate dehydrogenase 2 [Acaryochloris thomasi RCC1774]|uniref:Glycerol-3-phosphate dehydrogenase n=1 Tax=Acaryochloris thomasi RCC1774 TaxID=1764569 RepID=A0A2W1JNK8_9CYAN|nr:glycerol-3-phosphate dehydrogenase [Acaryochloris thomasi]PZD71734.1 Glycerol-3-phosphate dehydrogenase 2 [Acaryochloris thomasi RCC1774]